MAVQNPDLNRPICNTSAFGRVFYGVDNFVYYSQTLVVPRAVGNCYQINDPTSDVNPDLLATDGGRIEIDEATGILALFPFRLGILVFAQTGIWYIYGPDGGFSANNFNVSKISERVLNSALSIVQSEGIVFFLADSGIMQVLANEFDNLTVEDISETSIRSWYLSNLVDTGAIAEYRDREKQIIWTSTTSDIQLVFDVRVPAFYPQRNANSSRQLVRGVNTGQDFVFSNYQTSGTTCSYNFARDNSSDFKDFGTDQVAYLVSAYETLGKFSHKKAITYCTVFFNRTESQITSVDTNGDFVYDSPSSCLFQSRWDFDDSNAYGKWTGLTTNESGSGKKMQLYDPMRRGFIPDVIPWTMDTGESVIRRKIKIRGNGDAVQFRFEAQPENDMQLLGYSVNFTMRGKQ